MMAGVLTAPSRAVPPPLPPQVYNTDKLRLLLVGPQVSGPASTLAARLAAAACHTRRRLGHPATLLTVPPSTRLCPPACSSSTPSARWPARET